MKTSIVFTLVAVASVLLGGCVSNKKYALLQSQYGETRENLIECNAETRNLRNQLDAALKSNDELRQGMAFLRGLSTRVRPVVAEFGQYRQTCG